MGGQIWLDSEPGVGTTFTFTVWLGVGEEKGSGRIVPEKLAQLRALVVDDNAAAREILGALRTRGEPRGRRRLRPGGDRGHPAADAREPYDIVFMDWRMPGMDGLQASRHLKADATLKHPPAIVMVTAFGRDEVREEAERLQLDGFLVKPVTRSMLVDTLVNVFADAGDQAAAVATAMRTRSGCAARGSSSSRTTTSTSRSPSSSWKAPGARSGRRQRTEAVRQTVRRPAAAALRRGAHGLADARDGWPSGDREDPFRRALRHAADHRHDGARHAGGTRALPRRRHERPHRQAHRSGDVCSRRWSDSTSRQPVCRATPAPDDLASPSRTSTPVPASLASGETEVYLKLLRQFVEQQSAVVGQIAEAHRQRGHSACRAARAYAQRRGRQYRRNAGPGRGGCSREGHSRRRDRTGSRCRQATGCRSARSTGGRSARQAAAVCSRSRRGTERAGDGGSGAVTRRGCEIEHAARGSGSSRR